MTTLSRGNDDDDEKNKEIISHLLGYSKVINLFQKFQEYIYLVEIYLD